MPELPEVETTLRGITPYLLGNTVAAVLVRDGRLRWPVAPELRRELPGRSVAGVRRRGKYLLISFEHGHVIVHRRQWGEIFHELARHKESKILEGHLMGDHVHVCLSIPPKYAVANVVGYIKGKCATQIARAFGGRRRNFTGENFWARNSSPR